MTTTEMLVKEAFKPITRVCNRLSIRTSLLFIFSCLFIAATLGYSHYTDLSQPYKLSTLYFMLACTIALVVITYAESRRTNEYLLFPRNHLVSKWTWINSYPALEALCGIHTRTGDVVYSTLPILTPNKTDQITNDIHNAAWELHWLTLAAAILWQMENLQGNHFRKFLESLVDPSTSSFWNAEDVLPRIEEVLRFRHQSSVQRGKSTEINLLKKVDVIVAKKSGRTALV